MKREVFYLKTVVHPKVCVYKWWPEDLSKVIGVVQIAHGMVETAARYERLANVLTNAGYVVYANDHLGHGKTAKSEAEIGILQDGDFENMVEVMYALTTRIKKDFPERPVYLLGHSMGSFLSQRYIQKYGTGLKGAILSGTAGKTNDLPITALLVKLIVALKGKDSRAHFLTKVQFGGYNKRFAPNRTAYDWLSRDDHEVDAYIDNPYCGATVTQGFFQCLITGLKTIFDVNEMKKVPTSLPIYIFVGSKDPVGGQTKSVSWLIETYKTLGIADLTHKFYPEGRHEMLNELNKEEVMTDVRNWLQKH